MSAKQASLALLASSSCLYSNQSKCSQPLNHTLSEVSVASVKGNHHICNILLKGSLHNRLLLPGGRNYMEDEYLVMDNEKFKLLAVFGVKNCM